MTLLGFDGFRLDLLLLGRVQIAGVFGFFPHTLNSIHHVGLLGQKRIAQIGSPLNVIRKTVHYVRKGRQALDAWVPRLL